MVIVNLICMYFFEISKLIEAFERRICRTRSKNLTINLVGIQRINIHHLQFFPEPTLTNL